ncbi:uncharacterized protein LOC109836460 [Asparagus officinalis]|uniref:uncharacterized protein LOC109836460 n=1 Tax=Asparagus officinalis TaxID=4686 RepID=UPI00098E6FCD|nr:uncharacterized protein LOC109836460 [Asparagus officinalis]
MRNEDLVPYHFVVLKLAQNFKGFFIGHIPRVRNAYADALPSLATSLALPPKAETKILVAGHDLYHPKFPLGNRSEEATTEIICEASTSLEQSDWRFPFIDYVLHDILPDDSKEAAAVKWKALRFYYDATSRTLYRKSYDGVLLRCLSRKC